MVTQQEQIQKENQITFSSTTHAHSFIERR
uniref:Uncharacterized protein n=1 Tax=Rhizophora mucronata TaxID=61149 RepID=A0A2P2QYR2_RHIMU